jgi:iron(III) transport system substrate-binding protein
VKLFWPNQGDRGVHVNLSGIGLTKHAPHPEAAKALVEWMTGEEAQKLFADINQEFPANPKVSHRKKWRPGAVQGRQHSGGSGRQAPG